VTPSTPPGLYILGFGGHARSVADIALTAGIRQLLFVDATAGPGEGFAGFPAVAAMPAIPTPEWQCIVALGNNAQRRALSDRQTLAQARLIAPSATVGIEAQIGAGVVVAPHARIGAAARIGRGAIINTGAIVDHETEIGEFTHVSINAAIAGRCRIGSNVMIGAGATVIDGITIGDDVTIGAGATVVADIVDAGTYLGTPARRVGPL